MANKTGPIGVRFRKDILESLKKKNWADSPQKALSFLERFYVQHHKLAEDATQILRTHPFEIQKITPQTKEVEVAMFNYEHRDQLTTIKEISPMEAYEIELRNAQTVSQVKVIASEFERDKALNPLQKKNLRELGQELSKNMYDE